MAKQVSSVVQHPQQFIPARARSSKFKEFSQTRKKHRLPLSLQSMKQKDSPKATLLNNPPLMNQVSDRCQCLASCPNPPLKGHHFCSEHKNFCPRKAPLSGYEPPYEPKRWNLKYFIRKTHNCFSYAFNLMDPRQIKACLEDKECDVSFHQPGSVSGWPKFTDKDPKTCPNMIGRLIGDNPTLLPSAFELKCPKGTSKIALVVDEDQDYHFYRQDSNGLFSHKPGGTPVKNTDAQGHTIFDVQLANHNNDRGNSDPLNYDRFCGYFCVPRDRPLFAKTGGSRIKYPFTRKRN